MATKIYIDGNFLIAEDTITRDIYFKVHKTSVFHYRSNATDNIYAFFLSNDTARISGYIQSIQLGRQEAWDFEEPNPKSKTNFEFSDIVDGAGVPYLNSDTLDTFLNTNLG